MDFSLYWEAFGGFHRGMIIFPAIDIKDGKCVRLLQGRADAVTNYFEDPAEPARLWVEAGAEWVHVVDLDGAFAGRPANLGALERIAALGVPVQFGGGLRTAEDVRAALAAGASRVVVGTRACEDEGFVRELADAHGEKVAVGIDARDGYVAVKGWVDVTRTSALDLARSVSAAGVRTLVYTDITTDGMLQGPNVMAQREMCVAVQAKVVASGGVSAPEDVVALAELARECPNLEGVIVGKALYEGRVDLRAAIAAAR